MKPILQDIFKDCRIIGLAGVKSSGKTNNLCYLLQQLKNTEVYFFGMDTTTTEYLLDLGFNEFSSLNQLVGKKNCIIIIDEFQKLRLNDRRYKDVLNKVVDFVYHNNIYLIFSTPNIREFNTIIGGFIEKWLLKTILVDMCINGSQLKKMVEDYKGRHKQMNNIILPKDKILVINNEKEKLITCEYIKEIDDKAKQRNIFEEGGE